MKQLLLLTLASAAVLGLASCGSDTKCGTGTTNEDGVCVPDATCGAGTVEMNGTCVPDGSMICAQGTKFNPDTGKCENDPTQCGPGTASLNGVCVGEDDASAADLQEKAEPNDGGAGTITVGAVDSATTFHGCISPGDAGVHDTDPWVVNASAPMLIEVTTDGVHGLAAGFVMFDVSDNPKLAAWQRLGINLTGDTSKRQVYLPAAGSYVLMVDDSRSLFLNAAAGGTNTCYFGTVKRVAMPAATALTVPQTAGNDSGNVRVLSFDASATGDILDLTQNSGSTSMVPSFVVLRNNVFQGVATADTSNGVPPFWTTGGLNTTGDQVTIVVDNEYNYDLTPQAYTIDSFRIGAQPLPTTGTQVTATKHNGETPSATYVDLNYFYLDVATAGQIVHFNLTSSVAVQMRLVRHDIFTPAGTLDGVANINTTPTGTTTFDGQYVRFAAPGRYYFVAIDPAGTSGDTYTITSTLTNMTTTAVTYGTAMTAQALTAQGSTFFTLDTQAAYEWVQLGIPAATNWGTQARITIYDLAGAGWLAAGNYVPLQTGTQPIDGSAPQGRITLDDTRDYLVRVESTTAPSAGATFTLDVKERPHTNLGTITAATPITRTGMDNAPAGGTLAYLIKGTAGYLLTTQAAPVEATADIKIERRSASEAVLSAGDSSAAGLVEIVLGNFGFSTPNWQAFTITNKTAAVATDINLTINTEAPLAFTDICATGGNVLPGAFGGTADDNFSAVQTLPGGFNFYGTGVTNFVVNANGLLSFGNTNPTCNPGGCWQNAAIPAAAQPNGFIAAFWSDLEGVKVCRKDDVAADTVTVQWTGVLYGTATKVEFQTVLHSSGAVDVVFGPNHQANGSVATVGAENAAGTAAQQLVFNTAGATPPNSSFSIRTP